MHTSAGQVETLRVKAPPTKEAMTQYAWRHSAPRVVKAVPVKEAPPLKAPPGVKAVPVKEAPPLKAAPTTEAPLKAPPAEPQKAPPLKALPLKAAHAMPMVHYLTVQALPVKAPPDEPMPALQCARTPPTTMPVPVTAPSTTTMPVPVTAPSSTAPMPAVPAKAPPALPRMPPNAAQGAEQLHILAGQVETRQEFMSLSLSAGAAAPAPPSESWAAGAQGYMDQRATWTASPAAAADPDFATAGHSHSGAWAAAAQGMLQDRTRSVDPWFN